MESLDVEEPILLRDGGNRRGKREGGEIKEENGARDPEGQEMSLEVNRSWKDSPKNNNNNNNNNKKEDVGGDLTGMNHNGEGTVSIVDENDNDNENENKHIANGIDVVMEQTTTSTTTESQNSEVKAEEGESSASGGNEGAPLETKDNSTSDPSQNGVVNDKSSEHSDPSSSQSSEETSSQMGGEASQPSSEMVNEEVNSGALVVSTMVDSNAVGGEPSSSGEVGSSGAVGANGEQGDAFSFAFGPETKSFTIDGCTLYESFTLLHSDPQYIPIKFSVGDFGLTMNDPTISQYNYCYKILAVLEDSQADLSEELRHIAICQYFRHSKDKCVGKNIGAVQELLRTNVLEEVPLEKFLRPTAVFEGLAMIPKSVKNPRAAFYQYRYFVEGEDKVVSTIPDQSFIGRLALPKFLSGAFNERYKGENKTTPEVLIARYTATISSLPLLTAPPPRSPIPTSPTSSQSSSILSPTLSSHSILSPNSSSQSLLSPTTPSTNTTTTTTTTTTTMPAKRGNWARRGRGRGGGRKPSMGGRKRKASSDEEDYVDQEEVEKSAKRKKSVSTPNKQTLPDQSPSPTPSSSTSTPRLPGTIVYVDSDLDDPDWTNARYTPKRQRQSSSQPTPQSSKRGFSKYDEDDFYCGSDIDTALATTKKTRYSKAKRAAVKASKAANGKDNQNDPSLGLMDFVVAIPMIDVDIPPTKKHQKKAGKEAAVDKPARPPPSFTSSQTQTDPLPSNQHFSEEFRQFLLASPLDSLLPADAEVLANAVKEYVARAKESVEKNLGGEKV